MTPHSQDAPAKPRKQKNFAQIAGSCKMAKLSDGYKDAPCVHCGTVGKLKICGFCHKPSRKK